jgi:hypothetical protein
VVWAKEQAVRRYDCRDSWAKDQWGRKWLTPKGGRPANGLPWGHRLTPNGGRKINQEVLKKYESHVRDQAISKKKKK